DELVDLHTRDDSKRERDGYAPFHGVEPLGAEHAAEARDKHDHDGERDADDEAQVDVLVGEQLAVEDAVILRAHGVGVEELDEREAHERHGHRLSVSFRHAAIYGEAAYAEGCHDKPSLDDA